MNRNGPPLYYDYLNSYYGTQMPSTVHVSNTGLSAFFAKYLLQKLISVFEWKLPESWDEDYFKYVLYCYGYVAVINTDKYGIICQQCGLRGYDIYYRPTHAVISNPLIRNTLEPKIGTQCTVIKLQPDYSGVLDIITYYADMFALISTGIGVAALNTKNAYVFAAEDKNVAESIKKMYDNLASGEPATVVSKKLFDDKTGKLKVEVLSGGEKPSIVTELINAMRAVEDMFDRDIGLPVMGSMKKERNTEMEVLNNNVNSVSKVGMWLDELQKYCRQTNKMFGLDLSVKWRDEYISRGGKNESTSDTSRSL